MDGDIKKINENCILTQDAYVTIGVSKDEVKQPW